MLLLLTACFGPDCLTYTVCDDGEVLSSCANDFGDCWYDKGGEEFHCAEGCDCNEASLEALEVCGVESDTGSSG